MRTRVLLLAALVVLTNVLGNVCLSVGMKQQLAPASPLAYISVLFTPAVGLGVVLLIVWLLSRMALLAMADLSYVLPVTAVGYVLPVVAARLWLAEHVSTQRWAGAILIAAGAALVGASAPRSTR
jgi:uncharacterized membrane protein